MSRPSRDFTFNTSPSRDEMVPRTRTLVCASAAAETNASSSRASLFMGSPWWWFVAAVRRTPLCFAAFHAKPIHAAQENRRAALGEPAEEVSQEGPHRLVRSQPTGRRGRFLSRRTLLRPAGEPLVRRHPLRPHLPHRRQGAMGARRAVRRLAERPQVP